MAEITGAGHDTVGQGEYSQANHFRNLNFKRIKFKVDESAQAPTMFVNAPVSGASR
jgi:hypothetical protein